MNVNDFYTKVQYKDEMVVPIEQVFVIAAESLGITKPSGLIYTSTVKEFITYTTLKNTFFFFNTETYEAYFEINNVRKEVASYPIVKFLVETNLIKPIKTGGQAMKDDDDFHKAMEGRAGGRRNLKTQEIKDVSEHDYKDQDVIDVLKEDFIKILEKHRYKTVLQVLELIRDGKEKF